MDRINDKILGLIAESCGREDGDEIRSQDYFGRDLGLSSLQLVQLAAKIQKISPDKVLPFQDLLISKEGSIKTDIRVDEFVEFLQKALA